jgi:hypothetical protein
LKSRDFICLAASSKKPAPVDAQLGALTASGGA